LQQVLLWLLWRTLFQRIFINSVMPLEIKTAKISLKKMI